MASPRHVWVLIPAAGQSRRFAEAGYPTPKPHLRVSHRLLNGGRPRTMIEHVAASTGSGEIPCAAALPPALAGEASGEVGGVRIHTLPVGKTRGQADTIRQMVRWLPQRQLDETAVVLINCDVVFLDPSQIAWLVDRIMAGFVASMLVVRSNSPAMSYAHPYPCPQKFVEKQVIGSHAMAGAWAFASASRLLNGLNWACCQGSQEPYLSHAIGRIIGPKIAKEIEAGDMLDWGTPLNLKQSGARIVGP